MTTRVFAVGPASPAVVVQVPSGRLTFSPGEPGTVSVTVSDDDAGRFDISQHGGTIRVLWGRPRLLGGSPGRVNLEVPPDSDTEIETATGEVVTRVALGTVRIKTLSGDCRLEPVGELTFNTASGDLALEASRLGINVKTASGDVRVGELAGSSRINTASGDITVDRLEGSLSCHTASGDVEIGVFAGGVLESNTMSGDLTAGLRRGTEVNLTANTLTGDVDLPPPGPAAADGDSASVVIKAASLSGDVTLRRVQP